MAAPHCDSRNSSVLTVQIQQHSLAESTSGQSNHPFGHQKTITHSNENVRNLSPQMKRPPFPPSATARSKLERAAIAFLT